ncbi:MAG: beta-glucosidase BglX [Lentimicrobiaceae bacterium]|nr:beta-glucosidase BglX [Lentimicrobiaceae bacterium]
MKFKLLLLGSLVPLLILTTCTQKMEAPAKGDMTAFIDGLMKKMTLEEKIGQLNLPGSGDIITGQSSSSDIGKKIKEGKVGGLLNIKSVDKIRDVQKVAVEESRLGIPLIFGMDVIHGYQTTFPIPLGLASSFDMALIEQSARIAAVEASADGICWAFSPMVDIARDPRWGRIAEGAGEDAYLGSRVAEAYVHGYQGDDLSKNNTILACVKHYALYGAAEAGRDYNTTDMSRIRMFNEYLPPYQAAVKAGVGSVMTSFNEVDGIPATGNKWLMTDVLRDQWGFNGFVVTDYTAINEMIAHGMGDLQTVSALALKAGVDMDMIGEGFLTTLKKSLDEGKVTQAEIDQACRRILEAKYKLGLFEDPYRYCDLDRPATDIATEEHNRIAREAAAQTFVLLKNEDQLLPLEKKGKIALVGPLADSRDNMAGMWSVAVDHAESVTVLEGFKEAVGDGAEIFYAKGSNIVDDKDMDLWVSTWGRPTMDTVRTAGELRKEAVALASKCDVIIAAMGEAAEMSGESSCRSDISLPGSQKELLEALLKTGKPIVLVLFTGRPLTLTWEQENIPAILNVWFGGTQAGSAIADVIFGKVNPSGKLPVTFPQTVGQIPLYYNHKNTGRPLAEGEWYQKYRSNYLDVTSEPLYPFGFGLSYTRFGYGDLVLDQQRLSGDQTLTASIDITNTGNYDGAEVVQLYIRDLVGSITRPVKELRGFQKVFIKAGETKTVTFKITPDDLKFYNYDLVYDWEPGEFVIMVGGNSRDVGSETVLWEK